MNSEEWTVLPPGARLCPECASLDLASALVHLQERDRSEAEEPMASAR